MLPIGYALTGSLLNGSTFACLKASGTRARLILIHTKSVTLLPSRTRVRIPEIKDQNQSSQWRLSADGVDGRCVADCITNVVEYGNLSALPSFALSQFNHCLFEMNAPQTISMVYIVNFGASSIGTELDNFLGAGFRPVP